MTGAIAVIVKGYPRLSETFIAQELRGLERRGLTLRIFSLRRPTDRERHPIHREIEAPVVYLPEYLHAEARRVLRAWRTAATLPGYVSARRAWLADLARDPTRNRIRRFGQALVLAAEMPGDIGRLHAHFLHTPASVARYASLLTGLPWSCSAHAKDIWTIPEWEKREKLAGLDWLATCTAAGARHLGALSPDPDKIALVYHGLDHARFPASGPRPPRDGRDANDPVTILSVGRLVAKKGYADLLAALARLPRELHWRFVHIGGGKLGPALRRQAARLAIADRVIWLGARSHDLVIEHYRRADVFALACRVAEDGDRDGLPNVLLEAQSQGLACLSTTAGAVPELIEPGINGLLAAPGDPAALAEGLGQLIARPELRARLGKAGAEHVRARFAFDQGLERLVRKFGASSGTPESPAKGAAAAKRAAVAAAQDGDCLACALRSTRP